MAKQISSFGIDILSFDRNPFRAIHFDVQYGTEKIIPQFSNRSLMLSWPDANCKGSFAYDAVQNYGGKIVIYIGEIRGNSWYREYGHTSSEEFQSFLFENFTLLHDIKLPFWPLHRDKLTVWMRKEI